MLNRASRFNISVYLDNHTYQLTDNHYEALAACGSYTSIEAASQNALDQLQSSIDANPEWWFGHLSYDLKNEIEGVSSTLPDHIGFPDLHFFIPDELYILKKNEIIIGSMTEDPDILFKDLTNAVNEEVEKNSRQRIDEIKIEHRINEREYRELINKIKEHIKRGDCYELNYCMEFYADIERLNTVEVYEKLQQISPNPFSAYYRMDSRYLLCASPERYLCKKGDKLISQPIKGTSPRLPENEWSLEEQREKLFTSQKDRSENVMVVDLVRNDLSRICEPGSVKVDELYGIYSFPQVHQMISTISGKPKSGITLTEMIRATFPMGSMTGAPKRRVMELIEKYETTRRGLFSGAIGYITPGGDFDFNVVIRSLLYNETNGHLTYFVGSGITWYSDANLEYEECLLKAKAMQQALL
jgi:para-aminobenzoate synthetase component I